MKNILPVVSPLLALCLMNSASALDTPPPTKHPVIATIIKDKHSQPQSDAYSSEEE